MAEEEKQPDAKPPYDPNEVFSGCAVLANKVYVTKLPLGIRLTFTEQFGEGMERARAAVFLAIPDAMGFKEVLASQLESYNIVIEEVVEDEATKSAKPVKDKA